MGRVVGLVRSAVPFEPLRIRGLGGPLEHTLAATAVVLVTLSCGVLVAAAAGWSPMDSYGWMSAGGWQAAAVRVVGIAGIGLAAVLTVVATATTGNWWRHLVMVAVALPLFQLAQSSTPGIWDGGGPPLWAEAARRVGEGAALLLIVVPVVRPWLRPVVITIAAVAAAQPLVTLALLGELTRAWEGMAVIRGDPLWRLMDSLETLLVLYLLWQLVEWARLVGGWAHGSGLVLQRSSRALPTLAVLVVAKLAWTGAGLADVLPAALGGRSEAWGAARADGVGSWLTASGLGLLAAYWLHRRGRRQQRDEVTARSVGASGAWEPPAWPSTAQLLVMCGVVAAPALLAGALQMAPGPVHLLLGVAPNVFSAHFLLAPAALLVICAAALWRLAPPRADADAGSAARAVSWRVTAAAFFVVLAPLVVFHVGPRLGQIPFPFDTATVGTAGDALFDPAMGDEQYPDVAPAWEAWWAGPGGTFEPVTLDTVITVGVAVLLVLGWRGGWRRRRTVPPAVLAAALVAATIYAHTSTLAPTGWAGRTWFYLAFVFPVVMALVIDARGLNAVEGGRGRVVMAALAFVVVETTIVVWRFLTGSLDPSVSLADEAFGFSRGLQLRFFLTPLLAAVMAAVIYRLASHGSENSTAPSTEAQV